MDKLIKWLENSFAPKLQKITNLTWIVVIKDSMMQLLPCRAAASSMGHSASNVSG